VATFVLVHGAWSGAYGFRHVRRLLQHRGHEVFTPSLTGIGERRHLTSPLVDLTTHVSDVVNHVLYEDLCDVVLVGFSYGGCVVTGAVDHISSRIRHLVYLDAFVPRDGDSIFSVTGQSDARHIALEETWLVPPPPRSFDDPAEAAFMIARRTAQPWACFAEAVALPDPSRSIRSNGRTSGPRRTRQPPSPPRCSTPQRSALVDRSPGIIARSTPTT